MNDRDLDTNRDSGLAGWLGSRLESRHPHTDWQPDASRAFALFQQRTRRKLAARRRWGWISACVFATSLSLTAFPATRTLARRCMSACLTQSVNVREFLAARISGNLPSNVFVKPGDRGMAPDFVLRDAEGRSVRLSEYRGRVVLLNFWATWCLPCTVEVPMLVDFQESYRNRGLAVLGVSLDADGWKTVKPYVDARRVNYPVMIGNGEVAQAYGGLEVIPTTLVIDRSGRIAATHFGLCRKDEYEADIRAVLDE